VITINLGLNNAELYDGCTVEEVGGRLTLTTPAAEAANILGRNVQRMVEALPAEERDTVTLTGPMAVWAYLVAFHIVVHRFGEVWYDDGRGNRVRIAKH
jgi:hypothetical protein